MWGERVREVVTAEARGLDGLLNVHPELGNVQEDLQHGLRLLVAARRAYRHERLAILHDQPRARRQSRAFAGREGRRVLWVQPQLDEPGPEGDAMAGNHRRIEPAIARGH